MKAINRLKPLLSISNGLTVPVSRSREMPTSRFLVKLLMRFSTMNNVNKPCRHICQNYRYPRPASGHRTLQQSIHPTCYNPRHQNS